jgi:hypothetical protein
MFEPLENEIFKMCAKIYKAVKDESDECCAHCVFDDNIVSCSIINCSTGKFRIEYIREAEDEDYYHCKKVLICE